jgi:catechol 2,3-dioxygenase-like lactoylglutathione lyase family enzyme
MADLHLDRLDHFVQVAPDLSPAYEALTRLGIVTTAPGPAGDTPNDNCFFNFGGPGKSCAVEWITQRERADDGGPVAALLDQGGGSYFIGFPVDSIEPARAAFDAHGGFDEGKVVVEPHDAIITLSPLDTSLIGCNILLLEYPPSVLAIQDEIVKVEHDFPIGELDHVAITPADLDASTRFWNDVLGVPTVGELEVNGVIIRQLQVGTAMVELLQPTGDVQLPPGLLQMIATKVDDVAACVELARERGFTLDDPGPGALPDTLVARFDPAELSGLTLHLLQYV